jgi:hypothetical protein
MSGEEDKVGIFLETDLMGLFPQYEVDYIC